MEMKAHWGLALLVILWTSADVTADSIMLNASVYNVDVKLAFQTFGKNLTTVGVVFDHPDIVGNNPMTYNVAGSYRNQLAIDHQGRVTLIGKFSRAYTYRVQFSTLVTAILSDNTTLTKYLEGWIYVRVLDAVYFYANASDGGNVSSSAKAGNIVFNCNDVIVVDKENFNNNPYISFSSYSYTSTFRVNRDGTITMRKDVTAVNPGQYSLRITVYYTLFFKNGTRYSGRLYQYIRLYILGCSSAEEGNVQFPILHSCQATTHPCVKYHPLFKGGEVVRKCSIAGETLTLDFSNCSVSKSDFSTPFAVVSMTFSGTRGTTYISALTLIKRDVQRLFQSQASSVTEFTAYRSYKYYGFTMGFLVKLNQGTNDSIIAEAYQSLVGARRIGYQYLRYNRESRIVRAFLPSPGCKPFSETSDNFTQFVQICQQTTGSNCECADINPVSHIGTMSPSNAL